ncbi:hypothetical protein P8452_61125 [Trifolium repens]|nr:hypothetical protein P8452_61125 [Trifolium repens]
MPPPPPLCRTSTKTVNHALLEEIQQINERLIDTVVDISDENVDSTAAAVYAAEVAEGAGPAFPWLSVQL